MIRPDPRVVPMPADKRIGFYIAHVAEESLLARQLGRAIGAEPVCLLVLRTRCDSGSAVFQPIQRGDRAIAGSDPVGVATGPAGGGFSARS